MAKDSGNIYGPSGQSLGTANANYDNLVGQNAGAVSGYGPSVAGSARALVGQGLANPYAGQSQAQAGSAYGYGVDTLTPQLRGGASALAGIGGQAAGYVPQALATGFDPQNGLYNRGYQQTIDQQNAINAMSGVSNTPYGAGVTGDASRNFNLDWADRAGQRQASAAQTAGSLAGTANTGFTGAGNVGNAAIDTQTRAGALPFSTYNQNIMDELKLLVGGNTAVSGGIAPGNDISSQILQYLGYGTDASVAQQKQSNQTNQALGQTFGDLATLAFLA